MKTSLPFNKFIISIIAMIFMAYGCKQEPINTLSEADARIILEQYMETINNADMELIDKIIDPDFELHSPFFPEPLKGIENYKDFVMNTANTFSDFKATIEDVVAKGDKVYGRFSMEGANTGPIGNIQATGKRFHITGLAITKIVNGKIIKDETFWNVLGLYQQLGFTLAPPAASVSE